MTHVQLVVEELLHTLQNEFRMAQALPDMAISLLESALEDGQIPDKRALNNICKLAENFPPAKRSKIHHLMEELNDTDANQ